MVTHLNERQKEAVNHENGPLLIAAGAGSGKTHTLTSRLKKIIERGANPENIIAITFTNKAAKEMRDRIFKTGNQNINAPFIGTFHSLGAKILKMESGLVRRTAHFTIFDENDSLSLIKKIMKELEIDKERYNPAMIQNKISSIKNDFLDSEEHLDKIILKIFQNYQNLLIKNNAFDFDDLIEKPVWIFKNHSTILEKYRRRFQYILVDEYQDINASQYQLIKLLAEKHQNLSVVGDDQQAIYAFRGADFRNFLNFDKDWPNAKIVKLEQNYRSTGNIIAAASSLIKNNKFQKPKELWTESPEGELIKIVAAGNAEEEANFITDKISTMDSHGSSIAILYRTNAQSRAIEQTLIAANIPYRIFGGLKFYERKEIKDVMAALRFAFNLRDTVSAERIEKNFPSSIANHLLEELPRLNKELSILELINFFLVNSNYFDYLEKNHKNFKERIENVNELINFAASAFAGKSLGEFLERVSLLQSADVPAKTQMTNDYTQNPVNLMTIHLAKGLEFDKVFVVGCSDGLLPHQMSYGSMEQLEEERRLMYVAITRAKKELCLSFYDLPSRFLYEIPPELVNFIGLTGNKSLPEEENIYIDYT